MRYALLLPLFATLILVPAPGVEPADVVDRSVKNMSRDWAAQLHYRYQQREIEERLGANGGIKSKSDITYQVAVLNGSDYREVIARKNEPLPGDKRATEVAKLQAEKLRRTSETPVDRAHRIQKFNKDRLQEQQMLLEMVHAFDFHPLGSQMVNGRKTWVFAASVKPGYHPDSHEGKVLAAMRGKLWIDQQDCQWVKVEAEVTRSVTFAFGLASVIPGTRFLLEQKPVGARIWLPSYFETRVNANVLWAKKRTVEEETYSSYQVNN